MKPDPRRGFTLVEMLVVLVILAIVAGATAPAIRGLQVSDPLDAAVGRLTAVLGRARQTAVERGVPVRVSIDPATRRFAVRALPHGSSPEGVTNDSLRWNAEVRVDSPRAARLLILFLPTGEAVGDTVVLHWQGRAAAVHADAWTGEPHVASN